jgi:hypothetical protein
MSTWKHRSSEAHQGRKASARPRAVWSTCPSALGFPQGVKTIQGVTFTFYTKAVTKEHWQAACRHGGFGILAANFFPAKNDEIPGQAVKSLLIERVEDMGNPIDILLENHRAMLRLKAQPVA